MIVATLALLRHGHTRWNRDGRIQGSVDEPLDDTARAHLAALRLPAPWNEARLLSSPLRRAVETATILGRRAPDIVPELAEMDWGEWEGCRGIELLAEEGSGYCHIEDWGWDFRPPGGESPAEVRTRLAPWLAGLRGSALAVTHIGVMRVLLAQAMDWDFAGAPPFKVKRDRLYRIDLHADGTLSTDDDPLRLLPASP